MRAVTRSAHGTHAHDMALYVLPLQRAAASALRRACSLAHGGGSCHVRGPPPARAPCVPAPQPACRARHPPARRGVRVVCCPPAPGARPPCAPPPCAPSLTCSDAGRNQNCMSSNNNECDPACGSQPKVTSPSGWVCDQDPVALRLQRAQSVRRAEYEWEVAYRALAPAAAPCCPAPYVLGGERECMRATDGCTYAVLQAPSAARACCGRTPPPPQCVELAPDDACRIRGDTHLDPCAHRPRIMIEIDRSAAQDSQATSRAPVAACSGNAPATGCGATLPAPHRAPPQCRPPTLVERLRAYVPGCQSERRTHTSVAPSKAKKSSESVSGGLEGMLRLKEQLKEAGLGRVVTGMGTGPDSHEKRTGGCLELSVPPGTERVAVHVSLTRATGGACSTPPAPPSCAPAISPTSSYSGVHFDSTSEKQNPCLSIMKIKKTWTSQCDRNFARTRSVDLCAWTNPPVRDALNPAQDITATSSGNAVPLSGTASPLSGTAAPLSGTSAATPFGPAVLPRCVPDIQTTPSSNSPKTKIKRCSSTSAFIANTIVVNS